MEIQKQENPTPAMLLQQAIMNKLDINQLERLMKLQEDWEKRQAAKAFKNAFSNFQAKKPPIPKTKTAKIVSTKGTFSYKYSPLPGTQKLIDKILSECGLSYRWEQEQNGNIIKITCIISHLDGHEEKTHIEASSDQSGAKNNIQAIGSTITYLKRYTLEGALGLASDEDNDGKTPEDNYNAKKLITAINELDKVKNKQELQTIWNKYKMFRNHETFKLKVGNLNKKFSKTKSLGDNKLELK